MMGALYIDGCYQGQITGITVGLSQEIIDRATSLVKETCLSITDPNERLRLTDGVLGAEVELEPYYVQPKPYKKYKVTTNFEKETKPPPEKYMLIFVWSDMLQEPILICCQLTRLLPKFITL